MRLCSTPGTYARVALETLLMRTARGDGLRRLEDEVKAWTGTPWAVSMPRARVGIYLTLKTLISPGQNVILSPYTIYDVVNMVICAGGVPVFADVDRKTCNPDPDCVERLIDHQTGAVLVTHLHGLAMDLAHLAEVCRRRNVPLVEDCAQAFGARVGGRPVGTFGDAGIYSFGMYKNVNAFFGGMVVTRRTELHEALAAEVAGWPYQEFWSLMKRVGSALCTELVTWPPLFGLLAFRVFRYACLNDIESLNKRVRDENNPHAKHTIPESYLRRMCPLQARLALDGLARLERDAARRLAFARRYHEGLSDLDELICPPWREDGSHVYLQYPIQAADRKALVKHMMRQGCDVAVQHMRNCADLTCFGPFRRECPNAQATAESTVVLPTYPKYREKDVERNIRAVRSFFVKRPGTAGHAALRGPHFLSTREARQPTGEHRE
jgi:dTDP-4-amino-4,6-dideoxygalactose transaminase